MYTFLSCNSTVFYFRQLPLISEAKLLQILEEIRYRGPNGKGYVFVLYYRITSSNTDDARLWLLLSEEVSKFAVRS